MPKAKHTKVHKRDPVDQRAEVARDMARLGGRSRSDLERDDRRGAASPLGHGTGSKRVEKEKRK